MSIAQNPPGQPAVLPKITANWDPALVHSASTAEPLNNIIVGNFGQSRFVPPSGSTPAKVLLKGHETMVVLTSLAEDVLKFHHEPTGNPLYRVYRFSQKILVRIITTDNGPQIDTLDAAGLYGLLARASTWAKEFVIRHPKTQAVIRTRETVQDPPNQKKMIADLMSHPGVELPVLKGLSGTPMVLPDGAIVGTTPGYDVASGYYFTGVTLPDPPDVHQAAEFLLDWLVDFPIDESGRANVLGMLIAGIMRPYLSAHGQQAFPAIFFDAASPGSGKTLLAQTLGIILSGNYPEIQSLPESPEEWRKNITSWVKDGGSYVIYDNVTQNRQLDSSPLAALLTTGRWKDRLLGSSQILNLEVSAQVVFTGNNMRLSTELSRRGLWVRLTPDVDQPWQRTSDNFSHGNILQYTLDHRGEIINSILSLVGNWLDAGATLGTETLGSYEALTTIVGGVLRDAGIPGWLSNAEQANAKLDEDRAIWLGLLTLWDQKAGDTPTTAGEIFGWTQEEEFEIPWLTAPKDEGKRRQIGRHIANHVDAVIGPWKIVVSPQKSRTGVALYELHHANEPASTNSVDEKPKLPDDLTSIAETYHHVKDGDGDEYSEWF